MLQSMHKLEVGKPFTIASVSNKLIEARSAPEHSYGRHKSRDSAPRMVHGEK